MDQPEIVEQRQFASLEEFIEGQNNYYARFLEGNPWGESRRRHPYFQRFQELYPTLEQEVTRKTIEARATRSRLPYEKLFETYKLMSVLVYAEDDGVKRYSNPDLYLIS